MGTTTQAIINKSQDNENTITNQENDVNLENSKRATTTKTTVEPAITANGDDSTTNTTHISSNAKNECTTTETTTNITTSNEETLENIKILPKASPPPQVVIIPTNADTSSTVATNAAKKIRRAFSMPRNPFRWSHKLKTNSSNGEHKSAAGKSQDSGGGGGSSASGGLSSITKSYTLSSCVGGKRERANSFVSLNSNDNYAPTKATSNNITAAAAATPDTTDTQPNHSGMTLKQPEEEEAEDKEKSYNINLPGTASKSSNKKFSTKSNTINGVSTLTNSSTLPSGASLFSTLPAGVSNNNNNNNSNNNRLFRRSSFRKFLNRITQHMTTTSNKPHAANATATTTVNGHTISSTTDRVPPISGYQWPNDQTPGVMGLKNHGNTCFMNAVLQCLSHTDILAEYFVLDQYKADLKRRNKINSRKFGTKGELTEQLANVLKALWTCKNESDHSTSFKAVVDRYGSQFRSSTQHDAQEFLFWLLDKVHEDLNTATKRRYKSVKNNYGRPDEVIAAETLANHIRCNNSFVQAVFQAQFRSSLTCPRCKKQSNTFDPFHCISVQLPQLTQQTIFVTVVYLTKQPRQVRMGLTVTAGSPIMALREQLHKDTDIPNERMVLVDLQKEGFMRVFYDTQPVNTLQGIETIYCIEVPEEKDATKTNTNEGGGGAGAGGTVTQTANSNSNPQSADLLVLVANVKKKKLPREENDKKDKFSLERFGAPFCLQVPRDCSYAELQKKLLKEMSALLKPEVFSYSTPLNEMFQIRLQDPSADPDTFIEQVEHPLLTEMIDLALSVLSAEAGPTHVKLLLEWQEPEIHFCDLSDQVVEHESVPRLLASKSNDTAALTLEQCLEHYTKAETLSAEDAWRCPHCQEYLPVVKTLGLWSLPDILVVHFKRFRQHHGKGANAAKLTTMVNFPLHSFDMSPHLAKGVNGTNNSLTVESSSLAFNRPSPWRKSKSGDSRSSTLNSRDNRETRYDLYAVCYHQGDTLETGHYTAACKNPYDRQWYKFDDQRVSKVPNESLPDEIVNNEAYMLFYQRRTSEIPECSGSSSNSSDHWVSRIAPPAVVSQPAVAVTNKIQNSEDINKTESIAVKSVVKEDIDVEKELKDAKELDITKPLKEEEIKEDNAQPLKQDITDSSSAQNKNSQNNLDALEKLLDYADADVINDDDSDDLEEKLEKLEIKENQESPTEIFTMDEDCKLDQEKLETKDIKSKLYPNEVNTNLTNGYDKERPLDATNDNKTKDKTPSTSASSSSSSLASQSPAPSSLAVPKDAAHSLQTKFNGFLQSHNNNAAAAAAAIASTSSSATNEKEHLLSSSLKSNSSSIIGSALSGHFSTYRQPWHGSRSSVSAVENAIQPSITSNQHSSLHLRHSFSTASNYRLRECGDTLSSVLRNSVNTCSKDTLIFLDQQQHHHHHSAHRHHHSLMEDDDDSTFMGSRSLWISPVTPHKLITVSPKN